MQIEFINITLHNVMGVEKSLRLRKFGHIAARRFLRIIKLLLQIKDVYSFLCHNRKTFIYFSQGVTQSECLKSTIFLGYKELSMEKSSPRPPLYFFAIK